MDPSLDRCDWSRSVTLLEGVFRSGRSEMLWCFFSRTGGDPQVLVQGDLRTQLGIKLYRLITRPVLPDLKLP